MCVCVCVNCLPVDLFFRTLAVNSVSDWFGRHSSRSILFTLYLCFGVFTSPSLHLHPQSISNVIISPSPFTSQKPFAVKKQKQNTKSRKRKQKNWKLISCPSKLFIHVLATVKYGVTMHVLEVESNKLQLTDQSRC